ncbi:integrase-like protein [Chromatocurvus halotolerans]|uniref:Integrase-like protein n=1 Tax=Chromatocurvus halotolerans TaxID=1132028 RepID=A0A4R2LFZ4_9GAMM|nr:integrase-like protein [Chromatocurvus halotolerans]
MESAWGVLKLELVHHDRFKTREEALAAIQEYIEIFCNRTRKQARLGYLSPVQFIKQYRHMQAAN